MRISRVLLACLGVLLLAPIPVFAQGDVVEVRVTAIVTDVFDDLFNYLDGRVAVGDTITGTFTYILSTPDSEPDSTLGVYGHHEPPAGFPVSVSGLTFAPESYLLLRIGNDRTGDYPGDWASAWGYGSNPELCCGVWIWLDLVDESATTLQSDAAPALFPDVLHRPDRADIMIAQGAWEWSISGSIVELGMTPVDVEPATWGRLKGRYRAL